MEEIQKVIEQINHMIATLYKNEDDGYKELESLMPSIQMQMQKFLEQVPSYIQMGVEIPVEVIIAQLNNLTESMAQRDMVQLIDTLRYEIGDTLQFHYEILQAIEEGK